MAKSKVLKTPELKCYVNSSLLGTVTAFSWAVRSSRKELRGIDTNTVVEFAPTTYMVSGQVSLVRLHGDGGLEGSGIVAFPGSILLEKYLHIDLVDRLTDKVVFSTINAVVTEQTWQAQPKGIVAGTFSFECSDYTNEAA